MKAYDHLW